jgi:hypothetical protein
MRPLARVLQDLDLGHLRIIAELWGLDLPAGKAAEAAAGLAVRMLDPGLLAEVVAALPPSSKAVLDDLLARGGRAPVAELSLRFGPRRPVGPGKRDREKAWRDSAAALDGLWYRGLLGFAYDETPTGIQEFGYLPVEVVRALQPAAAEPPAPPAAPAPAVRFPAGGVVEDVTTVLAALRRRPVRGDRLPAAQVRRLNPYLVHPGSLNLVTRLLKDLGALGGAPLRTDPTLARQLLSGERSEVTARLYQAWRQSDHNDLADVAGLAAPRGRWPNDPRPSREAVLILLERLVAGTWYSIESFVGWTREHAPAFLRPGGDFDSWYLQESYSGRFLRGIEAWQSVEGGLLRHLLTGPLHWFGAVELGAERADDRADCFRMAPPRETGAPSAGPTEPARLTPDGRLRFPPSSSLPDRYQIARFADWHGLGSDGFTYRITPRALAIAASQRLDAPRLMALLEAACRQPVPSTLRRGIERWAKSGGEASLERMVVLRVKTPAVLARLRENGVTSRYLGDPLGPAAVQVRARDVEPLLAAAARVGLLIDPPEEQ